MGERADRWMAYVIHPKKELRGSEVMWTPKKINIMLSRKYFFGRVDGRLVVAVLPLVFLKTLQRRHSSLVLSPSPSSPSSSPPLAAHVGLSALGYPSG